MNLANEVKVSEKRTKSRSRIGEKQNIGNELVKLNQKQKALTGQLK